MREKRLGIGARNPKTGPDWPTRVLAGCKGDFWVRSSSKQILVSVRKMSPGPGGVLCAQLEPQISRHQAWPLWVGAEMGIRTEMSSQRL